MLILPSHSKHYKIFAPLLLSQGYNFEMFFRILCLIKRCCLSPDSVTLNYSGRLKKCVFSFFKEVTKNHLVRVQNKLSFAHPPSHRQQKRRISTCPSQTLILLNYSHFWSSGSQPFMNMNNVPGSSQHSGKMCCFPAALPGMLLHDLDSSKSGKTSMHEWDTWLRSGCQTESETETEEIVWPSFAFQQKLIILIT